MVRAFLDTPVDDELVEQLINTLLAGPSAGNTRSLELLVLSKDDANDEVESYWDTTLPASARSTFPWPDLLKAPVLLIPYVDPAAYVQRYSESDKASTGLGESVDAWDVPYWWVDAGAAVENLLLAAPTLGLGAAFFGQFEHEPAVRKRFGVPVGRRAVGTIAIGYPAVNDRPSQSASRPRRSKEQLVHRGSW